MIYRKFLTWHIVHVESISQSICFTCKIATVQWSQYTVNENHAHQKALKIALKCQRVNRWTDNVNKKVEVVTKDLLMAREKQIRKLSSEVIINLR